MRHDTSSFGDFRCGHCGIFVSSMNMLSGVKNRNHCPYCLWSCHLDLYSAGDRLSACKGQMKPIGLTMKKSRNKYRLDARGELMLIHECMECSALSINRIAADDDSESIVSIFQNSLVYGYQQRYQYKQQGIEMFGKRETKIVFEQLYGHHAASLITG
ncbi:MAG TPA: RNHCP domain-containing protein [Anaerolineales bacterium]|nr:RNHCP domain-containing protein [Anaerolineales bacterium]